MKKCIHCGEMLPIDSFALNTGMRDGRLNGCKSCERGRIKLYPRPYTEKARAARKIANKKYALSAHGAKIRQAILKSPKYRAYKKEYNRLTRSQAVAHRAVRTAITGGTLSKPTTCSRCGSDGRIEGHHEDYSRLLDIIWLCVSCHRAHHRAAA